MTGFDSSGILSGPIDGKQRLATEFPRVEALPGLVVLHRASKFRGKVVSIEPGDAVSIRSNNSGLERLFQLTPGAFAISGETVTLVKPGVAVKAKAQTASGSVAIKSAAKVARASRIYVEGVHDAELVEKVWGDDLRVEGVVIERLDGIDDLVSIVQTFQPSAQARLGVLVDHLVPGSKESRLAAGVKNPNVRVTGTPYVDVWQAIRPSVLGISAWPEIPRDRQWKEGICEFFGVDQPGTLWRQLLSKVNTYADLEPDLVGAVESLIDFVTTGE